MGRGISLTGIFQRNTKDNMKLDRRQFFKTIAAGAVVVTLPAVAVADDIMPETKPSRGSKEIGRYLLNLMDESKTSGTIANYGGIVLTDPTDIQFCRDNDIEIKTVDADKWDWNTLTHQKMCPETTSDEMIKDIIADLEGSIRG